ncbi:MAG: transglycosylase SLT domain-containing protein [Desulfovibrio sp.]|nr:transglycosylase SLT domain-containing protein [Desulfovibrio sp.]
MDKRKTLLALAGGFSLFTLFLVMLSGFVPQDEGPSVRRVVSLTVARLAPEDIPRPITYWGDGKRIWAVRQPVGKEDTTPPTEALQKPSQSRSIRFSDDMILLSTGMDRTSSDDRSTPIVSVPLLKLDGISIPYLFAVQPLLYGDNLDEDGTPLRWYFENTPQTGFMPFVSKNLRKKDQEDRLITVPRRFPVIRGTGLQRAAIFQELINRFSREFRLNPTLVKAIIYSESNFNSVLVSKRSAVGLMQILPQTAGADIHKFLYGHKTTITAEDLFDPEINIRYGTAYLYLLMRRYFSGVKDPLSREYCTVAAYNMGPNRVIRVFGPSASEAAFQINALSAEDVYETLINRLPRWETRFYLAKVRSIKQQYSALAGK